MTRASPLADDALRNYSSVHLAYEVEMFFAVGRSLPHDAWATVNGRAMLESFIVHLRNLADFLYPTSGLRARDVIAVDYFDDKRAWQEMRPRADAVSSLLLARERANKQLAHLSAERETADTRWNIKALLLAIQPLLAMFARSASPRLLDPAVAGLIPSADVLYALPELVAGTSSVTSITVSLDPRLPFGDEADCRRAWEPE